MAITKADLTKWIAKSTNFKQVEISNVITTFFECIKDVLKTSNSIEIRGFGSIIPKTRRSHLARNPKRPDQTYIIPPRIIPFLRFSNEIKARLDRVKSSIV
ncbi:MAG: HU family DNA-binding protein [bacterium]